MGRLRVYKALCKDHMAGVFRLRLLPNGQDYVYTQNTSECLQVQSPACNVLANLVSLQNNIDMSCAYMGTWH